MSVDQAGKIWQLLGNTVYCVQTVYTVQVHHCGQVTSENRKGDLQVQVFWVQVWLPAFQVQQENSATQGSFWLHPSYNRVKPLKGLDHKREFKHSDNRGWPGFASKVFFKFLCLSRLFCLLSNFLSTVFIKFSALVTGWHACCCSGKLLLLCWEKSAPLLACSWIFWAEAREGCRAGFEPGTALQKHGALTN